VVRLPPTSNDISGLGIYYDHHSDVQALIAALFFAARTPL